jgi:hypothetical protein
MEAAMTTMVERMARAIAKEIAQQHTDCEAGDDGISVFDGNCNEAIECVPLVIAALRELRSSIEIGALEAMHAAMFVDAFTSQDAPMLGTGFEAAIDAIIAEHEATPEQ